MKIFGIKNCDKVRATIKWCQSNERVCQLHDYRVDGIDSQLLDSFLSQYSIDELINKRSTTWRKLTEQEKSELTTDIIINNPTLLKRPIVNIDGMYHIGYFPEKMALTPVIQLSQQLIQIDSVTPEDKGCQSIIAGLLKQAGFHIINKRFGDVDNLFAWHGNDNSKSLMFLGHTDVVPTGDVNLWKHPPFAATIDGDYLYGRGAADMKAAVAAFTHAIIDYVKGQPTTPWKNIFNVNQ